MLKEFRAFILRGNVVDLAVGVVIGAAFGAIVTALVSGMINPLVSFVGTGDLGAKHFCIGTPVRLGGPCPHVFRYGQVFTAMISFVIIAAVVFFFVVKPVNHLMEMFKAEEPKEKTTRDCPECLSSIPVAATRCAYCSAKVAAAS